MGCVRPILSSFGLCFDPPERYKCPAKLFCIQTEIMIHFTNISGESFRELVDAYLKKALRKGIPPLFVDLRPLYKAPANVVVIEELCLNYATSLKTDDCSFDVGGAREPATALLWVYYFLAQHYDYKKEYDKAFEMINAAIEHTPTLIELFLLKGKLYKVN